MDVLLLPTPLPSHLGYPTQELVERGTNPKRARRYKNRKEKNSKDQDKKIDLLATPNLPCSPLNHIFPPLLCFPLYREG
jgi:hypothetical protein